MEVEQNSAVRDWPSWEDYDMVEVLGQGAFGRVFKVKKKSTQAR